MHMPCTCCTQEPCSGSCWSVYNPESDQTPHFQGTGVSSQQTLLCLQVPLHTLHTAAWNWPQPSRVWPERWTSPDAAGAPKNGAGTEGLASAFLPWGASCPSHAVSEVQVRSLPPGIA